MGISISKSSGLLLVLVFLTVSCLIMPLPVKAGPKTIVVPDDYPTIESAITNANDGDTIFVKKGTYHETLKIDKPITLIGEDRDTTIIKGILREGIKIPLTITHNNVTITGFTLSDGWAGIQLFANCCIVSGNRITNNEHGIRGGGHNCQITGNIVHFNRFCNINLESCYNAVVEGNQVLFSYEGIGIIYSGSNTISGNNVENNSGLGILLKYSHGNTLTGNNITNSRVGTAIGVSNANTFHRNNFIDNTMQVGANESYAIIWGYSPSVNDWNGNYWSDYNGTDSNRDGEGDAPYVINERNADNHPLMSPARSSIKLPELTFHESPPPEEPPPEILILSPQNKTYTTTEVPLTWTCDEQIVFAHYNLDLDLLFRPLYGAPLTNLTGNTTLPGLSNGTHTITVNVMTEKGFASQTVHFTVSLETQLQPEPFPTILVAAASAAAVIVVGAGLLVYFKKRKR
jgi:parallel beta-helix repeat protein